MKSVVITEDSETPQVIETPEPEVSEGEVKVKTEKVGVDGTDLEVIEDVSERKPKGEDYMILGHEAVGTVVDGTSTRFEEGDTVVPFVRRPTEEYSEYFDYNRPDMAPIGDFIERGIIDGHGFMSEYFVSEPEYLIKIPDSLSEYGYLVEPISITEKAMEMVEKLTKNRDWYDAEDLLILGNGRLGLLSAAMLVDDYNVTVYSRAPGTSPPAQLAKEVGAEYISAQEQYLTELTQEFDVVIETTGNSQVFIDGLEVLGPHGVYSILGIPEGSKEREVPIDDMMKEIVFNNQAIIGSVNSHRPHFERAIQTLETIPDSFLEQYETLAASVDDAPKAFTPDTTKSVVDFE